MYTTRVLSNTYSKLNQSIYHAKEKKDITAPANWAITPDVGAQIDTFAPTFNDAIMDVQIALNALKFRTDEKNRFMKILVYYLGNMIKHLNDAIRRSELAGDGLFAPADRALYRIDINDDSIPVMTSEASIMMWGKRIMEGEQTRISQGKPPLTQPDLAEVSNWFNQFRNANDEQSILKDNYRKAQKILSDLKPQAKALEKDIWDDVENYYRHEEPETKRAYAREWGVIYVERENEKDKKGSVYGEVTSNDIPLDGVRVEIVEAGLFTETGLDGTYEFIEVDQGKYTIRATKKDYKKITIPDVEIKGDEALLLNITLELKLDPT